MRMRKKKNGEARLSACSEVLYSHTGEPMTEPSLTVLGKPGMPVYLEIGAGKGGFACEMAKRHSDTLYLAMEKVSDCVVLGAERAKGEGVTDNLRFVVDTADNLMKLFAPSTVDAIFLNFSDPWSKKGYAKRRLTHRRYLAVYFNLLKDGGKLRFKTDNVGLFDFSLEEIEAMGLACDSVTRDLHSSEYARDNVMTEYEKNFTEQGMKINMVQIEKPIGYVPIAAEDFQRCRVRDENDSRG